MTKRPGRLMAGGLAAVLLGQSLLATTALATPGQFPDQPRPPEDAPNVLIFMLDDVGFASASTFGGGIPTPTMDALADDGLRYNNFHTIGICSPTRASLLTGRNHHAVEFGTVADLATPRPGYSSIIPKSAGILAQVLGQAGYDTAMLGKNHNVPTWEQGSLGPFRQWASGLGFRYFYGFHGGLTNQFAPELIENTRMIDPPAKGDGTEQGYVLDRDLADKAIGWLREQHTQHPDRPFLMYYAPGTAHAPIQAPREWIDRFKGKFDGGWDAYREQTFARQKSLGLIPANAVMAPRPEGIRAWNDLSPDERRVSARYMETYAGMLAYCDAQMGRVIDELKRSGRYDNTLIIFIQGDNGASGEGGELGSFNYAGRMGATNVKAEELAHSLANFDDIGGVTSNVIPPVGWTAAMDTPYPYYKLVASRMGGIKNGMTVTWPARISERGLRTQFAHVTDIMPTVLEAAGIAAPEELDGVAQSPFDGTSFAYSFSQANAPARHRTQYFEVFGHAAIYQAGWMLAKRVGRDPRSDSAVPVPDAPWQLYDLAADPTQQTDLAAARPDKVAELRALWEAEARRNNVLPLSTSNLAAMQPGIRPEPVSEAGRHVFYPSGQRYPVGTFPSLNNRNWTMSADIEVPPGGAQGTIATQGGRPSGWALTLIGSVPRFFYRASDRDVSLLDLSGKTALAPGRHRISVTFASDGPGPGRGGAFTLQVDGAPVDSGRVDQTVVFKFAAEDGVIGSDSGTSVVSAYEPPFRFTGSLGSVTFDLGPVQPLSVQAER